MTIYFTKYNAKILGKSFMNLRSLRFVDIIKILSEYDNIDNEYIEYVISKSIKDIFTSALKSKRYSGIVYSNPGMTKETILNVKNIIPGEHEFIFIDEFEDKPDKLGQQNFSKIFVFPTGNRKRILKCKPIENPLFYWLNNIEE